MRPLKNEIALLALPLVALACNKAPADEALRAAEQALAAAPEIQAYVPEEYAAVAQILHEARASFAAAHYTDALRAAQPLPDRIAAAAQTAAKRKQQSASAWSALSEELPARFEALSARLTLLASADAISSERLAAAQAELATLRQAWADATTAFGAGDVPNAVTAGQDVKTSVDSLARRLGLKPAAAPAAAAAQAPATK